MSSATAPARARSGSAAQHSGWLARFDSPVTTYYLLVCVTTALVVFGLIMVLNLMIGLLHPPMGMVLFVLARVAHLSIERTTMAILPWLVPLLVSLILITYVPQISLWLPRTFFF